MSPGGCVLASGSSYSPRLPIPRVARQWLIPGALAEPLERISSPVTVAGQRRLRTVFLRHAGNQRRSARTIGYSVVSVHIPQAAKRRKPNIATTGPPQVKLEGIPPIPANHAAMLSLTPS